MGLLSTRRQRRHAVVGAVLVAAFPVVLGVLGARINSTSSLAYGVYWVDDVPPALGRYASFCPLLERPVFALAATRGYVGPGRCPGGTKPLLKRVLATGGDVVSIDAHGVRVNGRLLPHSRPLRVDGVGRAMPQLRLLDYRLPTDEVLMMSDVSDTSFDARYFGPIPQHHLQEVVHPVWTWSSSR